MNSKRLRNILSRARLKRFLLRSLLAILALTGLFFLLNLLFPLPDRISYSTIITDDKGQVIHAYLTPDQKWRLKTELNEISPLLRKAIVAKEDRHFYSHPGINPLAMARAAWNNLTKMKRTSGASTITMQVARALEPKKRNIFNKIVEVFRAFQLELRYDKDEILQMYLNLVPYGGNIEGVKAASLLYFNKNPDHLSLAEITALSIIPNRPSSLVIGKTNDMIVRERNKWLTRFAEEEVFPEKEINDALAEPLTASRGVMPKYLPHLSYKLSRSSGNYLIKTNINLNTQLKTEKLVADYIRLQKLRNIRNAAVIIIDNKTNRVITYIGSSDFKDSADAGQVNGAAAIRQPGSTLKPLLYGLCFDEGILTPASIIADVPVNYQGYAPENYNSKFNGYVSISHSLEHSLNIPAVKSLQILGKEKLIDALSSAGFKKISADQNKLGLSMILGGCGASLEELTGLFAAFANGGKYRRPLYLSSDSSSNGRRILSEAATFMLNDILSRVNRPDFPINWTATEKMPKIAWKTGTSYGRRDGWSIGYNKNYTVGVWTGNFSGIGVNELSGADIATPLLFRIFNTIDYDSDESWFGMPADCDIRQVCSETGMIPAEHCHNRVTDYFIPLVSSTVTCHNRQEFMISADEKISYCKSCVPDAGYRKKEYKVIEPDVQGWLEDNKVSYVKVPPHNPDCEVIFKGAAPVIHSPANGSEYLINKKSPDPLQLVCKTSTDVSKVYWYINNKFYKSSNVGEAQFFSPQEGVVKISCTDDKGRNRDIKITVRYVNL